MTRHHLLPLVLVAALVAPGVPAAAPGPPTEQLRGAIDRVMQTLDSPVLRDETRETERRTAVRKIANDIFDFPEMARRSLARHWQARTDKEREEFIFLFGDLLERSYISKIETYTGEKIQYTGERLEGDYAVVSTKLIAKNGTEVPIDYRLLRRGDRWLVYDLTIEGVSLINNYRTQFNKIIQTASYAELVRRMRAKQGEGAVEDETKNKGRTTRTQ